MLRNTFATIDLNNVAHNVKAVRSVLAKNSQVMAVVKDDAYGHGMLQVSRAALNAGATWLAIAMPEEAEELIQNGIGCPILVLGKSNMAQKKLAVSLGLRQCAADPQDIEELAQAARELNKPAIAHLKVDTGMSRIGIRSHEEFMQAVRLLRANQNVQFEGIFTHFACSDEADKSFTEQQDALFREYIAIARENGFAPLAHASNSAGAIELPSMHYDMIRLGISLYGYYPSGEVRRDSVDLRPVMQVETEICSLREIEEHDTVGYGATFKAGKKTTVATLPIGYGDGYNRLLSGRGRVIVAAQGRAYYAPVIGRVCMDQIMIDVTGIPVKTGDRVVVMGSCMDKTVDADEIAGICGTISYEIVLGYSQRVPRIYLKE